MNRNVSLIIAVIGFVLVLGGGWYIYHARKIVFGEMISHSLPPLPYAYNALEPYIDAETMRIHHDKHHQAYLDKLVIALKDYPKVASIALPELLADLNKVPEAIREAVRNNGGGHYNHSYFWSVMTPNSTKEPTTLAGKFGNVRGLINKQYGSFSQFKKQFKAAAMSVFGSGWAWLVADKQGNLKIITTANQDTPLELGYTPLLVLDVWEHAYYLKHQNRRADYIDAWWNVVNWKQVERYYQAESQFGDTEVDNTKEVGPHTTSKK